MKGINVPFTDEKVTADGNGAKTAVGLAAGFAVLSATAIVGIKAGQRVVNIGGSAAGVETEEGGVLI